MHIYICICILLCPFFNVHLIFIFASFCNLKKGFIVSLYCWCCCCYFTSIFGIRAKQTIMKFCDQFSLSMLFLIKNFASKNSLEKNPSEYIMHSFASVYNLLKEFERNKAYRRQEVYRRVYDTKKSRTIFEQQSITYS